MTLDEMAGSLIRLIERVTALETELESSFNLIGRLETQIENYDYELHDLERDVHWIEDTISDLEDEVRNHEHA